MKRAKNSPIGTVECPVKGCVLSCQVYKFRPRTEGRTSVFSGKLYAECPEHGRIGSDGNPATSRYIETNHKLAGAAPAPEKPEKNSAPAQPAPARNGPAPKPGITPDKSKTAARPWWQPLID